ncbi:MAG: transposase family protein [Armatimonadetes bacterium]|nr:transposase family protein [Armatimonadota bacterium]
MAVCAMACGARSVYAIAQWGRDHGELVCEALGIQRLTTPDSATLHRIFRDIELAQGDETGIGRDLATVKIQGNFSIIAEGEGGLHGARCIHGRAPRERLYGSLPGYSKVTAASRPPDLCIGRAKTEVARWTLGWAGFDPIFLLPQDPLS